MRSPEPSACAAADKQSGDAAGEGVEGGGGEEINPDGWIFSSFAHFKMKRGKEFFLSPSVAWEEEKNIKSSTASFHHAAGSNTVTPDGSLSKDSL